MITITSVAIHREDASPVFGEGVIHVALEDASAGCFVSLKQEHEDPADAGKVLIDFKELPEILQAINMLREQQAAKAPP